MMITITVDAKKWGKTAKAEYKRTMKHLAAKLAKAMNDNHERFNTEK